ncbi:hypothetical protein BUALT_Bualt01G0015900 [Buddleja alternifolia]|uniref:Uncharacterized protein n=1 Tax=Buddleja alternifolia TaxID=168488 RepID=A0AAV6YE86_9LAMI|nr:hypothetical protein BUALT_Bualt01G0015900 [Buddleja alternifolia]
MASHDNGPSVVIVVFVSLGCIFFVFFCLFALWCFLIKTRKKKTEQEIDVIRADDRLRVKEDVVEGPHGSKAVVLSIEEDKHFEGKIKKNEKMEREFMHARNGDIIRNDIECGQSSSDPSVDHCAHHHLQCKS